MGGFLDIGASLGPARQALGITQRELADRLGVKQQQIARWESVDYRTASLERVASAAEALGLPTTSLPLAAESLAVYTPARPVEPAVTPVRDLGEIAVRLRAHTDELRDTYKFDRLGVFGSFARGEQTDTSDVDLLVDTEDPGGFRFSGAEIRLEEILGREVDLVQPDYVKDRIKARVIGEAVYVWAAR